MAQVQAAEGKACCGMSGFPCCFCSGGARPAGVQTHYGGPWGVAIR
ncbi:hypothetical protein HMPREF3150_04722 [Pseudomonas aeruginosa]|nr:hypothetical protein HMPREF3150_04722 [Pseudomonas aeruginosa]